MGYYSEVTIQVTIKHKFPLLKTINQAGLGEWDWEFGEDGKHFSARIGNIKWYDGYEHVDIITEFIENLLDSNNRYEGGIVCVGEDSECWTYGDPYEVGLNYYKDVTVDGVNLDNKSEYVVEALKDYTKFEQAHPELLI